MHYVTHKLQKSRTERLFFSLYAQYGRHLYIVIKICYL